jgi:hypothetical protein
MAAEPCREKQRQWHVARIFRRSSPAGALLGRRRWQASNPSTACWPTPPRPAAGNRQQRASWKRWPHPASLPAHLCNIMADVIDHMHVQVVRRGLEDLGKGLPAQERHAAAVHPGIVGCRNRRLRVHFIDMQCKVRVLHLRCRHTPAGTLMLSKCWKLGSRAAPGPHPACLRMPWQ